MLLIHEGVIFTVITYASLYLIILFALLCFSAGVMYAAEVMEEYPTLAKLFIRYTIIILLVFHVLLWIVDGLSIMLVVVGFISHLVYSLLLPKYPEFQWKDPALWGSLVGLIVSNYVWWDFLRNSYYYITEIAPFFFACVWLVPALLLLSLTSSETLPTTISSSASSSRINLRAYCGALKAKLIEFLPDSLKKRIQRVNLNNPHIGANGIEKEL